MMTLVGKCPVSRVTSSFHLPLGLLVALFFLLGCSLANIARATSFVTRSASSLELNGSPFRFAGVDIEMPVQNAMMDDGTVSHGAFTNFEISAALDNAQRLGANVVRAWSFASIGCTACLEPSPDVWNDQAFARDDYILYKAGSLGIRLIIPLVEGYDCQGWNSGARGTFTTWRQHSTCNDFYSSSIFISDFEAYISQLLNHVNPLTGLAWKDDPTILAWEEENEGIGDSTWSQTIATYIKTIDSNHLVSWGSSNGTGTPTSSDLSNSNIDMYDGHFYSDFGGSLSTYESAASAAVSANKVYYLGEMGWNDTTSTNLSSIQSDTDLAGDLPWDIEPLADSFGYVAEQSNTYGGNDVLQYYPGYTSGDRTLLDGYRTHAYAMQGLSAPAHEAVGSPVITNVSSNYIYWRGAPGAYTYSVARSTTSATSGFTTICSQCATDWATPWLDSAAPGGEKWYKVTAYNIDGTAGGVSAVWDTGATNAQPLIIDDSVTGAGNDEFQYSGSWSSGTDSGTYSADYESNDYHRSSTAGDSATLSFTGTQVALFGGTNSSSGLAWISMDGNTPVLVDFYSDEWDTSRPVNSSSGDRGATPVFVSPVLSSGSHTLTVTVTGNGDDASAGDEISIDAAELDPLGLSPGYATPPTGPSSVSTTTYGFADFTGQDVAVNGVHGGIDFGSGNWSFETYASDGAYDITHYVFFSSGSPTSESFTLPSGDVLRSIKISGIGTYSLSDGVNSTLSGVLSGLPSADKIVTGWTAAGTTITVTLDHGWGSVITDIEYGTAGTLYSFGDIFGQDVAVSGTHDGIDFGSGAWNLETASTYPYGLYKYAFFSSGSVTSASFTLLAGTKLSGITLSGTGTYSISDSSGVNTTLTGSVPNGGVHVATGWTTAGTTVTVTLSAGWGAVIDDVSYE
jgi:hypothetical protein